MSGFAFYPLLRFAAGVLVGCWLGVAVGLGIGLILAGRRVRQLTAVNILLRAKLRYREKTRQSGSGASGPVLVVPPGASRPASAPLRRAAGGR
jgi:hypothetical protein